MDDPHTFPLDICRFCPYRTRIIPHNRLFAATLHEALITFLLYYSKGIKLHVLEPVEVLL
jgi:hypothetical protein